MGVLRYVIFFLLGIGHTLSYIVPLTYDLYELVAMAINELMNMCGTLRTWSLSLKYSPEYPFCILDTGISLVSSPRSDLSDIPNSTCANTGGCEVM